jgi:hypothetical protein
VWVGGCLLCNLARGRFVGLNRVTLCIDKQDTQAMADVGQ